MADKEVDDETPAGALDGTESVRITCARISLPQSQASF